MKALLAFRHGEAVVNRPDLFVPGRDDRTYPLTDTGIDQARAAGVWVVDALDWVRAGEYVAAVSQFARAQQTYRCMRLPQTSPLILPGLNEQNWGDFMSQNPPEGLRASFDAAYETQFDVKPPGGESTLDLYNRLRATLHYLDERAGNMNLILVAHGRMLLALRMIMENIPPTDAGWRFIRQSVLELPNCGGLYYPDPHVLHGHASAGSGRHVAVLQPPYPSSECLSWLPFLGSAFEAASL